MNTTLEELPERPRLTLQPLRTDGPDALDAEGLDGISHITLIEIEVAWENEFQAVIVRKAADIFGCATAEDSPYDPIPRSGRLVQAVFLVQFGNPAESQLVHLRPPSTLRTGTNPHAALVVRWLLARGFALAKSGHPIDGPALGGSTFNS